MNISLFISALMQGMLYAPLALGVFLTFKILNLPDLTVDGSLVFGMNVCAMITIANHPILAIFAGFLAGVLAGICTGVLQTKLKINPILSGIITMTALYTVNFAVLGDQSNRYLQGPGGSANTIYKMFGVLFTGIKDINFVPMFLTSIIVLVVIVVLSVFFKTKLGLYIRAIGDNEDMVRSSSINSDYVKIVGIAIANGLVALSGAFICQQQKFADINCGTGMLVVGLACVIIGLVVIRKDNITLGLISAVVGSIIYRIILQFAYKIDMPSYFVKLLSAVIVTVAISMPLAKQKLQERKSRKNRISSFSEVAK